MMISLRGVRNDTLREIAALCESWAEYVHRYGGPDIRVAAFEDAAANILAMVEEEST